MVLVGFKPDLWRPTGFLQCFDTVGLVIWAVKIIPEMCEGPSVTNSICWTCKNCWYKCLHYYYYYCYYISYSHRHAWFKGGKCNGPELNLSIGRGYKRSWWLSPCKEKKKECVVLYTVATLHLIPSNVVVFVRVINHWWQCQFCC